MCEGLFSFSRILVAFKTRESFKDASRERYAVECLMAGTRVKRSARGGS